MDLRLVFRVLWRFRLLVLSGFVFATALATLSYVRVEFEGARPTFSYRDHEQWESLSTLFVTSQEFIWGSVVTPQTEVFGPRDAGTSSAPPVDPAHLTSLAGLYMQLATSDPVLRRMAESGPINGSLQAFPVTASPDGGGDMLPMITLSAIAASPREAVGLARRHNEAFLAFLRRRQIEAAIPSSERVVVEIVRQPQAPVLLEPRKKTRPVVVFVAVMIATLGLAFVLENLRPRMRPLPGEGAPEQITQTARRSA